MRRAIRAMCRLSARPPWPRDVSLAAAAGLAAYAVYDSFQPGGPAGPTGLAVDLGLPFPDKWIHAVGYGLVSWLLCAAIAAHGTEPSSGGGVSARLSRVAGGSRDGSVWPTVAAASLAVLVCGVAEVVQMAAGQGRSGEWSDVAASAAGALLAAFLHWGAVRLSR